MISVGVIRLNTLRNHKILFLQLRNKMIDNFISSKEIFFRLVL